MASIPKLSLRYNAAAPPVVTLFCLNLPRDKKAAVVDLTPDHDSCAISLTSGESVSNVEADDLSVARFICLSLPNCQVLCDVAPLNYCRDPLAFKTEVNHWIDIAGELTASLASSLAANKPAVAVAKKLLSEIDSRLKFRTYLIGHQLSLGDISVYGIVGQFFGFNNLDNDELPVLSTMPHLQRWMRYMHASNPTPTKLMKTVSSAFPGHANPPARQQVVKEKKPAENENEMKKNLFEGKLPGAVMGQVVTRFPPEPSGYLHIGHAKAALLNAYYARAYEGRLIIRFDDTNPAKEKTEFEESIMEDLRLLDISTDKVSHTSDHFELIQQHCETLLKKGILYADGTPLEQMRHERGEGIESACRGKRAEENLRIWEEMKKGSEEGLKHCIRAKIDMQSKNKCMRDPVMYRCVCDVPHHIHGDKYKVYPMYDFACPIVDSIEGVTHAMRTNEYADRIPQYQWVIEACGLRPVIIYEFSRLNLVNTVLSKRKLQWLVDHQMVESWEDPRFPTVRGIRRRGLTSQALMEFILEQGPSKNTNLMEWDKIWAKNKQIIDPIVPRYMAVDAQSVPITLSNGPATTETKERDLHPKNVSVGTGVQIYSSRILIEREDADMIEDGEEITLMRWCNAIVEKIERNDQGVVQSFVMKLNPDGDFKKTKKKIHWVSNNDEVPSLLPVGVTLREFDHLITKKKPEDDDEIQNICNKESVHDTAALADPAIAMMKAGDMLQFERRGYFRLDSIATQTQPAIFFKIPDGKTKSMSVVQAKVDVEKLAKGN